MLFRSTSSDHLRIFNNARTLALFNFDGNVGIGTTNPSYRLHVNGAVAATSFPTISDSRLKKDTTPLTNCLATLTQLRGVSYDWTSDNHPHFEFDSRRQIGLIAQEVNSVLPEAVTKSVDGYYSIDYNKIVPVLVEALKEQQTNAEAKDLRINALETRINQLEKTLGAFDRRKEEAQP